MSGCSSGGIVSRTANLLSGGSTAAVLYQRFLNVVVVDSSAPIRSTYSSALTTASPALSDDACAFQWFYYEALHFTVAVNGSFAFYSKSKMDTFGVIHKESFDPSSPSVNQVADDDDSCGSKQFSVRISLEANTMYVLVVTTARPVELGRFNIIIRGPANVPFQRIGE